LAETQKPFLNIAHRGARAFAPENTIPAIRMAQRLGANAVELDVQMSRDGELIVFHDDDVTRCSDGIHKYPLHTDYAVSGFTWEELLVLDVAAWYVRELARPRLHRQPYLQNLHAEEVQEWLTPADADEYQSGLVRVPSLREALTVAHESNLAVVLILKTIPRRYPSIAKTTVELIRTLGMQDDISVTSFDHVLLGEVRALDGTVATGVMTAERLHRPREYVHALDADAFAPGCAADADVIRRGIRPEELDTTMIGELTDAGIMVNVWTENSAARMRALIDAGVTGIFTDYPNRLAGVLAAAGCRAPIRPRLRRR
jgi:glycerophosphoryl diester phosphodiesterase